MSVHDLFPPDAPRARIDLYDRHGYVTGKVVTLTECQRCGAWVSYKPRHNAWHRSVDTDQTVRLPPMATLTGYARVYSGDASDPDGVTMVPTDTQGARHDDRTRRSIPDPPAQTDREGTRREGG